MREYNDCFKGINGITKCEYDSMKWDEALDKIFSKLPNRTSLEIEVAKQIVVNKCRDTYNKVDEWISVNDRLPTKSNNYLTTKMCKNDDENLYEVCSEIFWTRDNKWDCERDKYCEWKVIAWQPLPSKYEE